MRKKNRDYSNMKKAFIFGTSVCGEIASVDLKGLYDIVGYTNNDDKTWGEEKDGLTIFPLDYVLDQKDTYIIIAVYVYYMEIIEQLLSTDIDRHRILLFSSYTDAADLSRRWDLYDVNGSKVHHDSIIQEYEEFKNGETIDKLNDKQRVFIYARLFPPLGGGGVQRPLKLAKYLGRMGYRVIVVTSGFIDRGSLDFTLLDEINGFEVIRVQKEKKIPEFLDELEKEEILAIYKRIVDDEAWWDEVSNCEYGFCAVPDPDIVWVKECLNHAASSLNLSEKDIVVTTASPYSSLILGYELKRLYGVKLVMDFRDPWCENDAFWNLYYSRKKKTRWLEEKLEEKLVTSADAIVVISEASFDDFQKYRIKSKIYAIPNGYDEEDFRGLTYIKQNNAFTIVYNGSALAHRDPVQILDIINEMISEGQIPPNKIKLVLNGDLLKDYKTKLIKADKHNIAQINGYLPHLESLKLSYAANLLIIFGDYGETAHITYTGKLFEYLRTGVPILSYSSPYGVQHDLLKEQNAGITVEYSDRDRIKAFIKKLFCDWLNGEEQRRMDNYKLERFSRESIAIRFSNIFKDIQ